MISSLMSFSVTIMQLAGRPFQGQALLCTVKDRTASTTSTTTASRMSTFSLKDDRRQLQLAHHPMVKRWQSSQRRLTLKDQFRADGNLNGNTSGTTLTSVVNLNGYFPPLS